MNWTEAYLLADMEAEEMMRAEETADRIKQLVAANEAQAAEIERLRGDLAKAVEALQIARVHVANNAEGWSVSRAPSRDDLTIVDLVLAALTGGKNE